MAERTSELVFHESVTLALGQPRHNSFDDAWSLFYALLLSDARVTLRDSLEPQLLERLRRDRNIIRQRYYEAAIRHIFGRLRARHQLIEVPENRLIRVGRAIADAYRLQLNDAMDIALAVGQTPLVVADEMAYANLQQIALRRSELELVRLQEVRL